MSDPSKTPNEKRIVKLHDSYSVSNVMARSDRGSLIDRGANGGVAGTDVRVMSLTDCMVDITGIDDHELQDVHIGTVGGALDTNHGDVIGIFHQCAVLGQGRTIHSAQLDN